MHGRNFDYSTLVIAGAGDPQPPIVGISALMNFRRAFTEAQNSSQDGV